MCGNINTLSASTLSSHHLLCKSNHARPHPKPQPHNITLNPETRSLKHPFSPPPRTLTHTHTHLCQGVIQAKGVAYSKAGLAHSEPAAAADADWRQCLQPPPGQGQLEHSYVLCCVVPHHTRSAAAVVVKGDLFYTAQGEEVEGVGKRGQGVAGRGKRRGRAGKKAGEVLSSRSLAPEVLGPHRAALLCQRTSAAKPLAARKLSDSP